MGNDEVRIRMEWKKETRHVHACAHVGFIQINVLYVLMIVINLISCGDIVGFESWCMWTY